MMAVASNGITSGVLIRWMEPYRLPVGCRAYAVSIALVRRDGVPVIGVVYDPLRQRLWRAVYGDGVWLDGAIWRAPRYLMGIAANCGCAWMAPSPTWIGTRFAPSCSALPISRAMLRSTFTSVAELC